MSEALTRVERCCFRIHGEAGGILKMSGTAPAGQKYQTAERSEKSAEQIKRGEEITILLVLCIYKGLDEY